MTASLFYPPVSSMWSSLALLEVASRSSRGLPFTIRLDLN